MVDDIYLRYESSADNNRLVTRSSVYCWFDSNWWQSFKRWTPYRHYLKRSDLLEAVQAKLGTSYKIGTKANGSSTHVHFRLQLSNVAFYRWLQAIGLHPNKSKTLGSLDIPDNLYADFLRGCFDGDGSIWSFWDRRWVNSYVFYLTFTAASPRFLRWLEQKNKELFNANGSITATHGAEQLRYGKRATWLLYKTMYSKQNCLHLHRKQQRLIAILEADPYAVKYN